MTKNRRAALAMSSPTRTTEGTLSATTRRIESTSHRSQCGEVNGRCAGRRSWTTGTPPPGSDALRKAPVGRLN